jgi:hypothetical protein
MSVEIMISEIIQNNNSETIFFKRTGCQVMIQHFLLKRNEKP